MLEYSFYSGRLRSVGERVFHLVVDILMLAWGLVGKAVLPTRGRKGNILSSLHDFYIGVIERVSIFERGVFRRSVVFDNRYVKRGLLLVSCFLFLLSSLEWMPARLGAEPKGGAPVAAVRQIESQGRVFSVLSRVERRGILWGVARSFPDIAAGCPPPSPDAVFCDKRWILFRAFRI